MDVSELSAQIEHLPEMAESAIVDAINTFLAHNSTNLQFADPLKKKEKVVADVIRALSMEGKWHDDTICVFLDLLRLFCRERISIAAIFANRALFVKHAKCANRKVAIVALRVLNNILFANESEQSEFVKEGGLEFLGTETHRPLIMASGEIDSTVFLLYRLILLLIGNNSQRNLVRTIRPSMITRIMELLRETVEIMESSETKNTPARDVVELVSELLRVLTVLLLTCESDNDTYERESIRILPGLVVRIVLVGAGKEHPRISDAKSVQEMRLLAVGATVHLLDLAEEGHEMDGLPQGDQIRLLVNVLSDILETQVRSVAMGGAGSPSDTLTPVLMVMHRLARGNEGIKNIMRGRILPGTEEGRPMTQHELEDFIQFFEWLVVHMRSTQLVLKATVSDLLWTLCNEDKCEFVARCGIGNAAGYLADRGLLSVNEFADVPSCRKRSSSGG